ncbi:hypothetical protein CSKR_111816 [Clonorchis sinensis]|uniref:SAM domain-containing protein n=1 Tax=Clonorchis sinensis TaxID=79923 RepID=A0A8T1MRZ0_CLOSI|nr:hypothetical protein CSKR_111816 [Clonorchis sinensis]
MSSEASSASPKDNGMSIPTICLDSLNESGPHLEIYFGNSDSDSHSNEDHQTFSHNVANFCSWLSCFGAQRKFIAAAVLLSQCDPGFRQAAIQLFQTNSSSPSNGVSLEVVDDSTEFDHLALLQSSSLTPTALLDQLWSLLGHLIASRMPVSSSKGVPITLWNQSRKSSEHDSLENVLPSAEQQRDRILGLKKHYLRLFTELLCHSDNLSSTLTFQDDALLSSSSPDSSLKESIVQSLVGQMLLKTLLHPLFTMDERNQLLSTLRTHRQSACPDPSKHRDEACAQQHVDLSPSLRCLDVLLELASDMFSVVHSLALSSEHHMSSLSHSLTSSGFLSGGGGSGSQYDLLSEATNFNGNSTTGPHYGTLLTVPTPDCRNGPNHMVSSPSYHSAQVAWNPGPGQRHLSDGSCVIDTLSTAFTPSMNSGHTSMSRVANSMVCGSRLTEHPCIAEKESPATAFPSLGNFPPHASVGRSMEQTADSVSLSSASSTLSYSFEYGTAYRHGSSVSPTAPSGNPDGSKPEETVSLPPSPSGMAVLTKNEVRLSVPSSVKTSEMCPSSSSFYTLGCALHGSEPDFSPPSQSLHPPTVLPGVCSSAIPRTSSRSCWAAVFGYPVEPRLHTEQTTGGWPMNTYTDPNPGMGAIPAWLKSLRLHKYAGLFERLTYDEFMNITETWLESHNVTQGARTKLLLNIRKLAMRSSNLSQAENSLVQAPSTGPGATAALQNCLTEVWNVLQTPLKPCSAALASPEEHQTGKLNCVVDHSSHKNNEIKDGVCPASTEESRPSGLALNSQPPDFDSVRITASKSAGNLSGDHAPRDTSVCLPSQIMNCLTKVCSRLLVSSQPDSDCFVRFVQLLDIIGKHPAFLDKHRSLTASWKQQIFSLENSLAIHMSTDPSRPSHSVPRIHHGIKPGRKNPAYMGSRHQHAMRKPSVHSGEIFSTMPLGPHSSGERFGAATQAFFPETVDTHEKLEVPVQPMHSMSSERVSSYIMGGDDSSCRRHSVPINQLQTIPIPLKSCPGRRMPSPNPGFMPSRKSNANVTLSAANTCSGATQASSDVDVSRLSTQFPGARFPGPSSFEHCLSHGLRRALVPPATAPPTRMPSPSDVQRQAFFPLDSPLSSGRPVYPSSFSTSRLTLDDLSRPGFSPQSLSNVSAQPSNLTEFGQHPCANASHPKTAASSLHRNAAPLRLSHPDSVRHTTASNSKSTYGLKPSLAVIPPMLDLPAGDDAAPSQGYQPNYAQLPGKQVLQVEDQRVFQPGTFSSGFNNYPGRLNCLCGQPSFRPDQQMNSDTHWPSVPNQMYPDTYTPECRSRTDGPRQHPGVDDRMECIEHDLELLTRNVTELAIGDFDSAAE